MLCVEMTGRISIICALLAILALSTAAMSQTRHSPSAAPQAKPAQDDQLYRNSPFGFRYKIPYGWVDRTKEMREPAASETADSPQGDVLLAVFERPPNAPGDTINSAVVIASESAASYHGLKKAEDYLAPLTELATAKGFKPDGGPEIAQLDSRRLIRANFSKPLGADPNGNPLTMHQATLILLTKGQIVSFTFIAGSQDEIDDLIDGLHFFAMGR